MEDIKISKSPFDDLPEYPGIYAIYLDLSILYKPIEDKEKYPNKSTDYSKVIDKIVRSHILSKPKDADINIYGNVKNNYLKISAEHKINWDGDIDSRERKEKIIEFISKLTIMSKPVYIGKTVENTINYRVSQHKNKLSNINYDDDKSKRTTFSRQDDLPYKLYRRGIKFKDLLIVSAPTKSDTPDEAISLGETFLQSLANPSLSVSN